MIMYGEHPRTDYWSSKDDRNPGKSTNSLQELNCDIVLFKREELFQRHRVCLVVGTWVWKTYFSG